MFHKPTALSSPASRPRAVAIGVTPTGGRRTKADHPALPMTPAEQARAAAACREAGAAMIHVHVRDAQGRHVLDVGAYDETIRAIRAEVRDGLVIQITSESLGLYAPPQQRAVVRAVRPEAVSLALREVLPDAAGEGEFADFLLELKAARIAAQFILYDPAEAVRLAELHRRGLVPWPEVSVLYVLGRYTPGQVSQPEDLRPFLAPGMPRFASWMTCAFGRHEAACVVAGAEAGGHVRVGFENNLWLPDGSLAPDNAALVRAVAAPLAAAGIGLLDAAQLRQAWGIG